MSGARDTRLIGLCALLALSLAFGCGDSTAPSSPGGGGGGSGGGAGSGGTAGTGAAGGTSGTGGTAGDTGGGGMSGTGGTAGSGGTGGSAGVGGEGGASGVCRTTALCHSCPSEVLPDTLLCDDDDDCAFPGYECIPSGCRTHGGAPIGQCQPARGGSCGTDADCPNPTDYDCGTVGAGGKRCLRVTAGCSPSTEAYDCAPGFSCESGACVDRRVPCDSTLDCPKSFVCTTQPTASFCVRIYRTCHEDNDCAGFAPRCADVDGDGALECAGELLGSDSACVNDDCGGSDPVCENGTFGTGADAVCGNYGLCRSDGDCGSGFVCADVFQDGRGECVEGPRPFDDCNSASDCPLQQVCAAPQDGGPPSCQAGKEAQ